LNDYLCGAAKSKYLFMRCRKPVFYEVERKRDIRDIIEHADEIREKVSKEQ